MNDSQFKFIISESVNNNLTKDQKNVLKVLSHGSELQYEELLRNSSEHIDKLIKLYYQRKPIIDNLNAHEIQIRDLDNWNFSKLDEAKFKKAIPILVAWLKRTDQTYHVKDSIIDILIENPLAKPYAFDVILQEFKSADRDYKDEWGYPSTIFMTIGNAFLRWVDDKNASEIFDLLNNKKFNEDNFLLATVANFKNPENIEKAKEILINELQNNTSNRDRIFTVIATLRRLKLKKSENIVQLIKPFTKNKDSELRNEAKKAVTKYELLPN